MPTSIVRSVEPFLTELAARKATPGGGAGSALAGAMGAALGEMSAAFTTGSPKFQAVEATAQEHLKALQQIRQTLQNLAEEDAEAYAAWRAASKLPKETEEEKAKRKQGLLEARERSTSIPEKILAASVTGLDICLALAPVCNPNLIADVAAAAQLLEACGRGAFVQIAGNLRPSAEDQEATKRLSLAQQQRNQAQATCRDVEKKVFEIMGVSVDTQ